MPVEVAGTIAGLRALAQRIDQATQAIAADAIHLYQLAGIANAPVGDYPDNSTNPPGDLARSIDVQGPRGAQGIYEAEVGPTIIYGRQRELGGTIFGHPYLAFFSDTGHYMEHEYGSSEVIVHSVHQFGAHYMLRAWDQVTPSISPLAVERISAAIVGS
jgi:hypothetical protein